MIERHRSIRRQAIGRALAQWSDAPWTSRSESALVPYSVLDGGEPLAVQPGPADPVRGAREHENSARTDHRPQWCVESVSVGEGTREDLGAGSEGRGASFSGHEAGPVGPAISLTDSPENLEAPCATG